MTKGQLRIVSLLPSATEIICALGLEDQLVGVTHECDFPASVRSKPVVTSSVLKGIDDSADIDRHIRRLIHQGSSIYALDADRLEALRPDLIVTQELCEVCAVSYPIVEQSVRRLDGPVQLVSLEPESLDDMYQTIHSLGSLTGRPTQAGVVIQSLTDRVKVVVNQVSTRPRRRVACLEWVEPLFNSGHWTPELVSLAGGQDLLGTAGTPAKQIDHTALDDAQPEVVVVMACGFSLERSVAEVERRRSSLPANGAALWVVDGNAYFSRPGPRLVDSVEIMAGILHPEVVEAPSPDAARRVA